ncbi:MAG TPA: PilZ domain-containing protein [Desulfopila sp.]|nr:PilZ domain-containing protein [Desulfopila sp.]
MDCIKVSADIPKNRLYIKIIGKVTKKAMEDLYTDARFHLADLQPEFDVISDYSECQLIHLNSIPALKNLMSYMIEKGIREIVRVVHTENTSHKQILNLATRVQGYKPIYVSTFEEAEERLENAFNRNGLRVHLHNLPVNYYFENEEGTGNIINMSTSGCAVEFTRLAPKADAEISLKVVFEKDDDSAEKFTIKANVVRVSDNVFAAEFIDFEFEDKERLWQRLVRESRI